MRLIPTSRAPEGATLGRDIQTGSADGVPLLRAGVRLSPRLRARLLAEGIDAVYIEDDLSAGIVVETVLDDSERQAATRAVAGAFAGVRRAMDRDEPLGDESIVALQDVVGTIIDRLEDTDADGATLALADMAAADAYTFQHSIDVAAVGLLIARRYWRRHGWRDHRGEQRFDRIDSRLAELGLGLLLHDIGKLAIPTAILHKPAKLDAAEWELMKQHPRMGVDLLSAEHWSPLVKSIVLRHHERWDGSGYPEGRVGTETHEMARIAAVADTFDAITSARPYAPARPAAIGVRIITEEAGQLFDPDIAAAFCEVVAPYPPGTEVTLPDGRVGVVVSVREGHFESPLVRTDDGEEAVAELGVTV